MKIVLFLFLFCSVFPSFLFLYLAELGHFFPPFLLRLSWVKRKQIFKYYIGTTQMMLEMGQPQAIVVIGWLVSKPLSAAACRKLRNVFWSTEEIKVLDLEKTRLLEWGRAQYTSQWWIHCRTNFHHPRIVMALGSHNWLVETNNTLWSVGASLGPKSPQSTLREDPGVFTWAWDSCHLSFPASSTPEQSSSWMVLDYQNLAFTIPWEIWCFPLS